MIQSILDRLIQGLDIAGVKAGRGRVKEVAEKTGYSEGMVSRILNGKNDPAEKFIIAVCAAFNINKQWVETGNQPATVFAQGLFDENAPIAFNGSQTLPLRKSLVIQEMIRRLEIALEERGVNKDSRSEAVANVTGCSIDLAAKVLAGDADLKPAFVLAVCEAFGINIPWVVGGKPTNSNGVFEDEPGTVDPVKIINPDHLTPSQILRNKIKDAEIDLEKIIKILPGLADPNIQKALQSAIVREAILEIMKMPVSRRWEAVGMLKRMNEKDEEQS